MPKEKEPYKRYMVFQWDEYDNTSPFSCCVDSFNDLESAEKLFNEIQNWDGKCIFDRIEGIMVVLQETP